MPNLKGKRALITGASRGIGRAIALELARSGVNLALNYLRNEEAARATLGDVKSQGVKADLFQANVGDPDEMKRLFQEAAQFLGGLDIFIHSAALGAFKPVLELKPNQWDLSFDVNLKALWVGAQEAVKRMNGGGVILSLSSLGSHRYIPEYGAIGISKAALENLIRYLAVELAPKKIRVNAISGGPIDTDALKFFPHYEEMKRECLARTPAGRIGTPEDIAKVARFLCSEDSSWIIGQTIIADGGLSLF